MDCIFCKIVQGDIPCNKIIEGEFSIGFMDINPISEGHSLFIPKKHAVKLHEIDDDAIGEILGLIKKVVIAGNIDEYNILQNNGSGAGQVVMHAHFHLIPQNHTGKLNFTFNSSKVNQEEFADTIRKNL